MRSRLTVLVTGIAIGAVGATLVSKMWLDGVGDAGERRSTSPSVHETLPTGGSPSRTPLADEPEASTNEAVGRTNADDGSMETTSAEANQHSDLNRPEAPAGQVAQTGERVPISVSDAHKDMLARADGRGQTATHEELEAQPEDDSWSYFMEQALAEFIGGHPNADKFVIFNIECRTTLCEIQAVGYDGSTSPDWSRILYDLRSQPWQDFEQVGSSSTSYQGQLAIVTHLRRRNSEPATP